MPCVYNQSINCLEEKCEKCGWNPDVSQRRKLRARMSKGYNIAVQGKLQQYQRLYSRSCFELIERLTKNKLNKNLLMQIADGKFPRLYPDDWALLNQTLDHLIKEVDKNV